MKYLTRALIAVTAVAAFYFTPVLGHVARAQDKFITVASTTSTQNSGLFGYILPIIKRETGIEVRVVAVGTGQALAIGRKGDADVLFVHDPIGEKKFVAEGYGVRRYEVMYNDFVIVGPKDDPAKVGGSNDVTKALATISKSGATFVSRGDDSGTNRMEMRLWKAAKIDPKPASGKWYREAGAGMGATLNLASGMNAYTMSDRATWLKFANKGDLKILVEGDSRLFNQYGVILVNPKKHPHVKVDLGNQFIDWLLSKHGQQTIAAYRIKDSAAFFPNAKEARQPNT